MGLSNSLPRPLINKTIDELFQLFEAANGSCEKLAELRHELGFHKKGRKARELLAKVESELARLRKPGDGGSHSVRQNPPQIADAIGGWFAKAIRLFRHSEPNGRPRTSADNDAGMPDENKILRILSDAKRLAQEYRRLTGRPLGITGEVAEYEAWRILKVKLAPVRQAGYDATEDGSNRKLQIKGRCLLDNCKPGQMLGSIRTEKEKEWDAVLMVLLDKNFDAIEIYEAERAAIIGALSFPGSKARNERGAMAVSKFKSIGKLRWRRDAK